MAKTMNMNLAKLIDRFHSEDKCRAYLKELRWPDGVVCPHCSSKSISKIKDRGQYDCNKCRYQFSVTADTIFHDSHLPLWKWFLTIYMMLESKKGISANQIKRTIDVSYKTAWYLCHRIRKALKDADTEKLEGIVEVDETYIGGKEHGIKRGRGGGKTIVVGAIQRGGDARLKIIDRATMKNLHKFVKDTVSPETDKIITDEFKSYLGIGTPKTEHIMITHLEKWVDGEIHTNSIENVWSLLKRSIIGAYHNVSTKHLDAYLDELEFRFNNRDNPWLFRDTLKKLIESENVEYHKLVAS